MPRVVAERRADRIRKRCAKKKKPKAKARCLKRLAKVEGRIGKQKLKRAIRVARARKFSRGFKKAAMKIASAIKGSAKWINAHKQEIKQASNLIGEVAVAVNPELEGKVKSAQDKLDKGLIAVDKVNKGIATVEELNDLRIMIKEKRNIKAILEKSAKTLDNAGNAVGGTQGQKLKEAAKEIREAKTITDNMMIGVKEMIKAYEKKDIKGVIKAGEKLGKEGKKVVDKKNQLF